MQGQFSEPRPLKPAALQSIWLFQESLLNDLGPAASFIAAGFNLKFDVQQFEQEAWRILDEVEHQLGWMYEVLHTDGNSRGRLNYMVWSEIFSCSECSGEINFVSEALESETGKARDSFPCPHCGFQLNKDRLERCFVTKLDPVTQEPWKRIDLRPVFINYSIGRISYERPVTKDDLDILAQIYKLPYPHEVPSLIFPVENMYHGSRIEPKGFKSAHHFYFSRTAHALGMLWRLASEVSEKNASLARALKFWLDSHFVNLSIENRYRPGVSYPYNLLSGVYYVSSMICEADYLKAYANKLKRISSAFSQCSAFSSSNAAITTGDCASLSVPNESIDYIFTDPPFGANIFYADLNLLVESWHGVISDSANEAIVDSAKKKGVNEYQNLMRHCFSEYSRVLKPGRWMTVVFSNSSNSIWRAIQEAMGASGFVVADVRTLDKQQGSYRQVTSTAVKQDLVISAYKPTKELQRQFDIGESSAESAWAFAREHLHNAPRFVGNANVIEIVAERTPQMLLRNP
ncbi:DNA methyltransferase [Synechococcus sp. CBW1004]|uniref:DNA methyltransferase n=1 Tax=Synechococcus sp. CBW1004 TaxID=1353136 RepID=UPI0018CCD93E|nr:DNA methyltransferase [Synechococcus sp. CBW1004]QPN64062.1 hypothetical protein H8F25_04375 [Synechococcus sp. CBW1004]